MFCLAHFISPGCPDGDEGYAPPGFCEHCRGEAARRVLLDRILLHPVQQCVLQAFALILRFLCKCCDLLCRKCADRHDQGLGAVIASI